MIRKAPYFKYWMDGPKDLGFPMAFYLDENGSDVSGETLLKSGKKIPMTPDFKTWERLIAEKRRCSDCWICLPSRNADRDWHMRAAHGKRMIA